jgi:hypothetical protein
MRLIDIATQAGMTSENVQQLIQSGEGSPGLAGRIGATSANITAFISGRAYGAIAQALGTTISEAQVLRDMIGREGAIGLILGLASGIGFAEKNK